MSDLVGGVFLAVFFAALFAIHAFCS